MGRIRKEARKPTSELLLEPGSAWNNAAIALLGAPKVVLTWGQGVGLSTMGLSSFVELYHAAQAKRKADTAR